MMKLKLDTGSKEYTAFQVTSTLYYGETPKTDDLPSTQLPSSCSEWVDSCIISFEVPLSCLPMESRIHFVLHGIKVGIGGEETILGWANLSLFAEDRNFISGTQSLGLWPSSEPDPSGVASTDRRHQIFLSVEFPEYPVPLRHVFSQEEIFGAPSLNPRTTPPASLQVL